MKIKVVENINFEDNITHDKIKQPDKWYANEGRYDRIARYRKLANLDESCEITEDNIVDWALKRTCVESGCSTDRLKAELLGEKWSDFEDEI